MCIAPVIGLLFHPPIPSGTAKTCHAVLSKVARSLHPKIWDCRMHCTYSRSILSLREHYFANLDAEIEFRATKNIQVDVYAAKMCIFEVFRKFAPGR